jgi:hypothetical protein
MSLQRNLLFAEEAIAYVDSILYGKASNRPEDIAHILQRNLGKEQYQKTLDKAPKDFYTGKSAKLDVMFDKFSDKYHEKVIEKGRTGDPEKIKQRGVGNCFEHAVLVGDYLKKKGIEVNVYILETLDEPDPHEYLDHVWNVLEIAPELPNGVRNIALDEPPGFGPHAVVCDAWFHEWFSVQNDWERKMRSILRLTSHEKDLPLPAKVNLKFTKVC